MTTDDDTTHPENLPTDASEQPVEAVEELEASEDTPQEPEAAEKPISKADMEKRLNEVAAEARRSARKKIELLQRENQVLKGQRQETVDEQVERLVQSRLEQEVNVRTFTVECNKVAAAGRKEVGEAKFEQAMENFRNAVPFDSPAWTETVLAAMEVGDAHKTLIYLGTHEEELEQISNLSPAQKGAAIAKIAAKLSQPKATSKAPRPVSPISPGNSKGEMEIGSPEWFKAEDKREADRRRGRLS